MKVSYSKAGASHVLAVSGLHVGIVFLILNYLLGLVFKGNLFAPRLIKSALSVLLLLGYAALTGFSPSVMRATVMFAFLQFGFLFQRPYYVYSSIIASAFILLLFNPHLLFDVGFQLSYSAVLSILFFQPRLSKLGLVENIKKCGCLPKRFRKVAGFFVNWSVDLTTVSIAAQIGTLPLVLYYFHQFACLFWLSGLFVIPLATCLIYLGVVSLLFCYVPYVSTGLVAALSFVASVTNKVVALIAGLSCSVIDWIDFGMEEVVLFYGALVFFALYLVCRRYVHLVLGSVCMCFLLSVSLFRFAQTSDVSLAVYNCPGQTAVNLYGKSFNKVYTTADSTMLTRRLKRFWIKQHTTPPHYLSSRALKGESVSVFVVDKDLSEVSVGESPIAVDNLVVSSDVRIPADKLNSLFKYKNLIVDSSCSLSTSYWWKKQCPEAYLVLERGDFIVHM